MKRTTWALAMVCIATGSVWLLVGRGGSLAPSRANAGSSVALAAVSWRRLDSRCTSSGREPFHSYPWPLVPFHREHAIRGYFGDPRTVFSGRGEGAFSFHNGVDISAWRGNRVYPVVSGQVVDVDGDQIVIRAAADWRFQYVHVLPRVQIGEEVLASRTVIGFVPPRWSHIHLAELRDGCAVNPLAVGHLTPFHDTEHPQVQAILFESASGQRLSRSKLAGEVRVIAQAQDEPALAAPGQWRKMPVAPALLTWELRTLRGRILAHGVGADFRVSEPTPTQFCSVYAPGTEQNFAAVAGVYRWGRPGRFLFDLTPRLLATSRLPPGDYLLTVTASNLGGHAAARTAQLDVVAGGLTQAASAPRDSRCR